MDAFPLAERYWYLEGTDATRIDVEFGPFWMQLMSGEYRDDAVRRVGEGNGWLVPRRVAPLRRARARSGTRDHRRPWHRAPTRHPLNHPRPRSDP